MDASIVLSTNAWKTKLNYVCIKFFLYSPFRYLSPCVFAQIAMLCFINVGAPFVIDQFEPHCQDTFIVKLCTKAIEASCL